MVEKESASAPTPPTNHDLFSQPGNDAGAAAPSPYEAEKKEKNSGQKERTFADDAARRGVSAIRDPEEHAAQCLNDKIWMDTMLMGGFTREIIESKLKDFVLHVRMEGKERKTISDFKSHFTRWLKKTAAIAQQQAQQPKSGIRPLEERIDIIRETCKNFRQ
jgi:hypothetical protein